MIRKRITSMLIALVFILGTVCAPVSFAETVEGDEVTNPEVTETEGESVIASGECGDNLTWELTEDGTLTISGSGDMYDYYSFAGPWKDYSLNTIVIEEGVTSIGARAFDNYRGLNYADKLVLPESLERIGDQAFSDCSNFTGELVIPEGVTSIGYNAFSGCSGFTEVKLPENWSEYIDYNAFAGCSGLPFKCGDCGSYVSWLLDEEGTLTISGYGWIWDYSENGYNSAPWYEYREDIKKLVVDNDITRIGSCAFYGCENITGDLTMPENLESIGRYAFYGCSGITGDLIIPESVYKIGRYAFYDCTNLTGNITIPEGVKIIGGHAFYNCSGLTGDLVIPEGVHTIGPNAFYNCSGLTGELVIPDSVTRLADGAFEGCSGLTGTLTLPQLDCATSVNASAFKDCSGITEVVIPECYEGINGDAFNGCSSLTDFEVAEHIDWINYRAFLNCGSLNNVYINNDDIRIEMAAARVFPKKTVIHGNADSSAYRYAKAYDNEFQCLDEHSFGDWVITKKPTATESGEKMQTCSVCGHEVYDEIPMINSDVIWGDVDGNGAVYANDAMLVLQYSAELIDGSNLNLAACDVDGDGEVYANDAMLILQYSSELIDSFPVMQ